MSRLIYLDKPLYKHTVPRVETVYLGSYNCKDYYYRFNGVQDVIDIRVSNQPHDYSNWSLGMFHNLIIVTRDESEKEVLRKVLSTARKLKFLRENKKELKIKLTVTQK